jgi:hypothetical protein
MNSSLTVVYRDPASSACGRIVGQAVSHQGVPGSVHVGFVVDRVALGQVLLRVFFLFSPVSIIPPGLILTLGISLRGTNNRPVGGRSSETLSHSIDMNNNNRFRFIRVDGRELSTLPSFHSLSFSISYQLFPLFLISSCTTWLNYFSLDRSMGLLTFNPLSMPVSVCRTVSVTVPIHSLFLWKLNTFIITSACLVSSLYINSL